MLLQASGQRDHPKEVSLIVLTHLTGFQYTYVSNVDLLITFYLFSHRHSMLTEQQQLTPRDCLAVLRAAKKDFMAVVSKVFQDKNVILEMAECSLVVYYLQAVVILKHLQRPGVVEHMTVSVPMLFLSALLVNSPDIFAIPHTNQSDVLVLCRCRSGRHVRETVQATSLLVLKSTRRPHSKLPRLPCHRRRSV